jgi:hypothetical protein
VPVGMVVGLERDVRECRGLARRYPQRVELGRKVDHCDATSRGCREWHRVAGVGISSMSGIVTKASRSRGDRDADMGPQSWGGRKRDEGCSIRAAIETRRRGE